MSAQVMLYQLPSVDVVICVICCAAYHVCLLLVLHCVVVFISCTAAIQKGQHTLLVCRLRNTRLTNDAAAAGVPAETNRDQSPGAKLTALRQPGGVCVSR